MNNPKSEQFYPVTSDITLKLRKAKLTAAEWAIWSYLIEVDPKLEEEITSDSDYPKLEEETFRSDCGKLKRVEVEIIEDEEEKGPLTQLGNVLKRKSSVRIDEKVNNTKVLTPTEIPEDLIKKLEKLGIPLDERVRVAIASHHISQAYGAANHVDRTMIGKN